VLDDRAIACLNLWRAVLACAVKDWRIRPSQALYRFWHSRGFDCICATLDLDPQWARNRILPLKGIPLRQKRG